MQSGKNWMWRSFSGVMGGLIIGFVAYAIAALGWGLSHWESNEQVPWEFALIAFGPGAIALVGTTLTALRAQSQTGERAVADALIGGIGLPVLVAGAIAGLVWFNGYQDARDADERAQLDQDFWQFLDEAAPGLDGFSTDGQHRTAGDVRLATTCGGDDIPIRGRLIWLDDGLAGAKHLHRKLIADGYETELRRFEGPADTFEIFSIQGLKDGNYVRAVIDLVPAAEDSTLTFHMATGSCVDDRKFGLASEPQPGIPVEADFTPPNFAERADSPIGAVMWTRAAIPRGDGYERRCGRPNVQTAGLSRRWTTEDVDDLHNEVVHFMATIHAALEDDGWDTAFIQRRYITVSDSADRSEQRQLEAYRDDSLFSIDVTMTAGARDGATAAVLIQHHFGPCIGTLGVADALTDGWADLADPFAFTPL